MLAVPSPSASAPAAELASAEPSASAQAAPSYPPPAPPDPPIALHPGGKSAVRGEAGLVTSVEPNATQAGVDVLRKGGNAVDAAVAVAFALAVTHPSAGNIGGGGFMIVRRHDGETAAIDFRETAPAAATPEKNKAMLDAGAFGYASAAVPGTVAGLHLAHEKFGARPWAELLAPAIHLARKGHKLGPRQGQVLAWNWEKLKKDPVSRATYGHGKEALKTGDVWKQPDLARTLEAIAKNGPKGFYEGPVAEKIDKAMKARGGLITLADLAAYKAVLREPIRFSYRGFDVATMPPPSMGGVAFAEIMPLSIAGEPMRPRPTRARASITSSKPRAAPTPSAASPAPTPISSPPTRQPPSSPACSAAPTSRRASLLSIAITPHRRAPSPPPPPRSPPSRRKQPTSPSSTPPATRSRAPTPSQPPLAPRSSSRALASSSRTPWAPSPSSAPTPSPRASAWRAR